MNVLENVKTKIAEIKKQKEELVSQLRGDFAPMLQPFFERSLGKISSIGWTQYTPYFNDGDECVFSVHVDLDYGLKVNGEDLDDSDFFPCSTWGLQKMTEGKDAYDAWVGRYPNDAISDEDIAKHLPLYFLLKEISETLQSIDDEFFKDLFGDHVIVTVYDNGTIETEEYEHD